MFGPLETSKICVALARELSFHLFDHIVSRSFLGPKLPPNEAKIHPKIHHFSLLVASWAAPGASKTDFGRPQSAPGALGELFEIIKSFQNQHFDGLGSSWGPLGALRDPQEHPKSPTCSQNTPKCSQNASKIIPKGIQNTSKKIPKLSQNTSKMLPKYIQNASKIIPNLSQNDPKIIPKLLGRVVANMSQKMQSEILYRMMGSSSQTDFISLSYKSTLSRMIDLIIAIRMV